MDNPKREAFRNKTNSSSMTATDCFIPLKRGNGLSPTLLIDKCLFYEFLRDIISNYKNS